MKFFWKKTEITGFFVFCEKKIWQKIPENQKHLREEVFKFKLLIKVSNRLISWILFRYPFHQVLE